MGNGADFAFQSSRQFVCQGFNGGHEEISRRCRYDEIVWLVQRAPDIPDGVVRHGFVRRSHSWRCGVLSDDGIEARNHGRSIRMPFPKNKSRIIGPFDLYKLELIWDGRLVADKHQSAISGGGPVGRLRNADFRAKGYSRAHDAMR